MSQLTSQHRSQKQVHTSLMLPDIAKKLIHQMYIRPSNYDQRSMTVHPRVKPGNSTEATMLKANKPAMRRGAL